MRKNGKGNGKKVLNMQHPIRSADIRTASGNYKGGLQIAAGVGDNWPELHSRTLDVDVLAAAETRLHREHTSEW